MNTNAIDNALAYLARRNALPKLAFNVPAIGSDPRFHSLCRKLLDRSAFEKSNVLRADESAPFEKVQQH